MRRRSFLKLAALGSAGTAVFPSAASAQVNTTPHSFRVKPFDFEETTVKDLQAEMTSGRLTVVSLAKQYLRRIREIDRDGPALNSMIELNPDALEIAKALDKERKASGPRGPLHGIPVVIKDNIDTHDRMMTTAGSLALQGSIAPRDAFIVERLRAAGAVILGKTNLSEWANFRGSHSTSGWSGRGGQTRNPYVLNRNPSGSSSGSAVSVSANLSALAIGTETNGSILSPSSYNGIVGIKPTAGLVSRSGIIPISKSQDTAGPMARTVSDAAALLGALVGVDPRDPATRGSKGNSHTDYTAFLDANGLEGARIGVARSLYGPSASANGLIDDAVKAMKKAGAMIIDPVEFPSGGKLGGSSYQVLLYEFKAGLNAYLKSLGPDAPVKSLKEIIAFNERNRNRELQWFGQEDMIDAQAKGPLTDRAYLDALATCRRVTREEGIDAVTKRHNLDALIAPTTGPAHVTDYVYGDRGTGGSTTMAAVAGYPSITVPAGTVHGLPVGISFFGLAWNEPTLIKLAFAFEQKTKFRRAPRFLPTVEAPG